MPAFAVSTDVALARVPIPATGAYRLPDATPAPGFGCSTARSISRRRGNLIDAGQIDPGVDDARKGRRKPSGCATVAANSVTRNKRYVNIAVWAYPCRLCAEDRKTVFVSRQAVDALPPSVVTLRVKVDSDWVCARVDRNQAVDVEGQLVRDAVAAAEHECGECEELMRNAALSTADSGAAAARDNPEPAQSGLSAVTRDSGKEIQVAAISLQGVRMVVVLVSLQLVESPGEARLLLNDLSSRFGGAAPVLMGQRADGSPCYYGDPELVDLLAGVPVEKMPWRAYRLC